MSKTMTAGETRYGERIDGDDGNYGWQVRFDETDGYLGISQYVGDMPTERVLLSPDQVRALKQFLRAKRSTGRARREETDER